MVKALWKGTVIAQSNNTKVVEGNHYFPPEDVNWDYFEQSQHKSYCPWKGQASYYDVKVGGDVNSNAAWYYPDPSKAASPIKDHVAFWHGVQVVAD